MKDDAPKKDDRGKQITNQILAEFADFYHYCVGHVVRNPPIAFGSDWVPKASP